jgi:hypothetical protein
MIKMKPKTDFGVGPTPELSTRVSVATLARVVFANSDDGSLMLALEHKATLLTNQGEQTVVVKAQPFGGAIRLQNLTTLQDLISNFHFDSERSRSERDFRIFIRPSDWETVRDYCVTSFQEGVESDLESDPDRELVEEFEDTLGIELRTDQYRVNPIGIMVENNPVPTRNIHASGSPTVRIYRVFEVQILDPALCQAMIENSKQHPNPVLGELALKDVRIGGRGRANAMLVIPMKVIRDFYLSLAPELRHKPVNFENTRLDGNVPAVLEDIPVLAFERT